MVTAPRRLVGRPGSAHSGRSRSSVPLTMA